MSENPIGSIVGHFEPFFSKKRRCFTHFWRVEARKKNRKLFFYAK